MEDLNVEDMLGYRDHTACIPGSVDIVCESPTDNSNPNHKQNW